MNKYWHIACVLCSLLWIFASCSDDSNNNYLPVDEAWKAANIEAFDKRQYDDGVETFAKLELMRVKEKQGKPKAFIGISETIKSFERK